MGEDPNTMTKAVPSGWGRLVAATALAGVALVAFALGLAAALLVAMLFDPDFLDTSFLDGSSGGGMPAAFLNGEALVEVMTVAQLVGGGAALLFVSLLGGRSLVRPPRREGRRLARRLSWPLVASAATLLAIELVAGMLLSGSSANDLLGSPSARWPSQLLLVGAFCLSVGLFEEGVFRGLVLNGLLARMGTTRRGLFGAVILSSLVFGLVHVVGSDLAGPFGLAQAALKTLQAGVVGSVLAIIVLRTRSLWHVVIVHALFDFMSMVPFAFGDLNEFARSLSEPYVTTGEEAPLVLATYLVAIALSLPALVRGIHAFRDVPVPNRGALYVSRGMDAAGGPPLPAGMEPPS